MEAIIHPGMHKTGTSSIQATLMALKPEGWFLPDTPFGNMSGLFVLLFEDNPHEHFAFRARGESAEDVQFRRSKSFTRFKEQLEEGAEQGLNSLFTGERITLAPRKAVERLAQTYREIGYKPRVVAYVRRPVSFIESAFQQGLKGNSKRLNPNTMPWPKYRERFEKLDHIFGRENVQLSMFDPKAFEGGDVCIDFFQKIGVELSTDQIVRVNESMSLNACGLLFAQRNIGQGFVQGFKGAPSKNDAFVASLSRLPGRLLKFKRSILLPLFDEWRADLEWMEERLGVSLSDLPEEDAPDAIGSEEDLLAIADLNRDALEDLLIAEIQKEGEQSRDRLIRNLELLRKIHY